MQLRVLHHEEPSAQEREGQPGPGLVVPGRVVLVNPPTGDVRRDERCQTSTKDQSAPVYFPPGDLLAMAAIFEAAGWTATIIDAPGNRIGADAFVSAIVTLAPDVAIVSTAQPTLAADVDLMQQVRERLPTMRVFAKGASFYSTANAALESNGVLDGVLRHEFDFVCRDLAAGTSLETIGGLSFRIEDRIVHNPDRSFREDLDELPLPARHLLDNARYRSPESGAPIAVIQTGRGCPHHCIFCPAGFLSHRLRLRSAASIVAELTDCVEAHGIREFYFNADTFNEHNDWVIELCDAIVESGLRIRWAANARVDRVTPEALASMKRAGCWLVGFGVESGDQDSLDRMKKGTSVGQAKRAVAMCRRAGLKVLTFYCIGLPWETEQTLRATLDHALELDADFADVNIVFPLEGTAYWSAGLAERLFDPMELRTNRYANVPVRSRALDSKALSTWRRRILLRLHLRPSYVLRTLASQVRRPRQLVRYLALGGRRLWRLTLPDGWI